MRFVKLLAAAAAGCAATPALATSTLFCRSALSPTDGPRLSLVVGTGAGSGIVQARLEQGGRSFTTGERPGSPAIGQSWLDRHSLRLTIVDANAETEILRLEAWKRSGWSYSGTLRHGGRSWRVRCSEQG